VNYLNVTMQSFEEVSKMSVHKGADEEFEQQVMRVREALIEGYISILHGMNPDPENKKPRIIPQDAIDLHAFQMFYYLEALVRNTELTFSPSILKEIFELFFDLIIIFVNSKQPNGRGDYWIT
jgi:hypothetical protein